MSSDELLRNGEIYAPAVQQAAPEPGPANNQGRDSDLHGRPNRRLQAVRVGGRRRSCIEERRRILSDDVIRSLTLSQRLLGTTETLVVHHTDCGMLTFNDADLANQLEAEIGASPSFAFGAFDDVHHDVRRCIAAIKASPFIVHKQVRGFVYDIATGALDEVR